MCEDIEVEWKGQRVQHTWHFDRCGGGIPTCYVSECQDSIKLSMKEAGEKQLSKVVNKFNR